MVTGLLLAVLAGVAASLVSVWLRIRQNPRSAIAPAGELQRKYGLYAENRPIITLDPEKVPGAFRHLIPLAEKWGIGDDLIRNDYIDKASEAEKRELQDAFFARSQQITAWLETFESGTLTEEGEAFMYAQIALDEMGSAP